MAALILRAPWRRKIPKCCFGPKEDVRRFVLRYPEVALTSLAMMAKKLRMVSSLAEQLASRHRAEIFVVAIIFCTQWRQSKNRKNQSRLYRPNCSLCRITVFPAGLIVQYGTDGACDWWETNSRLGQLWIGLMHQWDLVGTKLIAEQFM